MAAFERETLLIPSVEDNVSLHVWFYKPLKQQAPYPLVVAGHGMTVIKDAGLATFGEQWAERAGFASLIFDYRGFGDSGGKPRDLVDVKKQLQDYKSVLKYARQHPETFRNDKMVVMGSALSGLSIAQLALDDTGLAGAMAHSPMLDGHAAVMAAPFNPRLMFWAIVDLVKSKLGLSPIFVRAVGKPGEFAFLATPSAYKGFVDMFQQGSTPFSEAPNLINPSISFQLMDARPGPKLKEAHCPVLIVATTEDDMLPIATARSVAENAKNTVTLVEGNGGHFDIMKGGKCFDVNVNAQIDFLHKVLGQAH